MVSRMCAYSYTIEAGLDLSLRNRASTDVLTVRTYSIAKYISLKSVNFRVGTESTCHKIVLSIQLVKLVTDNRNLSTFHSVLPCQLNGITYQVLRTTYDKLATIDQSLLVHKSSRMYKTFIFKIIYENAMQNEDFFQ